MDPQTELLLRKSALDEATLLLEGLPDLIFGFHAQQSVEKLLKALLAQRGIVYPRTHDLETLTAALETIGETLPATPVALLELTDFAVNLRYDDPLLPLTISREDTIATVRTLREFIHRRISKIESGASHP